MATTNLGLTLPTVGGDEDTWGDENNAALTGFDAAFAGAASGTIAAMFPNYLTGLTLSAAGSTATFGIAAGAANDSANAAVMRLTSAITKTATAWAVGSGNGALDTGSISAAAWYYVWLIRRPDTGVVDVLISTSASSPTMPANYTQKRRIGCMLTSSSQWVKFTQAGDEFLWDAPINSIDVTDQSTSIVARTLNVPPGIQVFAKVRGYMANGSSNRSLLVNSPDVASAVSGAVTGDTTIWSQVANVACGFDLTVRTNASAQVNTSASSASTTVVMTAYGWIDRRGRDG